VWRDFETTRVPLFEYDGQRKCLVVVGRDVTKRKHAEAELRDSKNHYQAIVSSFDGQIYICSQDYKILFMNNSLIERTGHDAIGEPCFKTLHGLETVCPWCVNERVFKGEIVRWEVQSPKDGRWYYVVNTPIYNEDGTISKQAMIQDITERKQTEDANRQLEQQFHHAQKLESLGVLAGGIAHDFNNILTVILGHCYVASEGPFSEQESKRHFEQIETAGNRAADLCRQMLTYAGKSQLVQTRVNLWLLIDEVVKMLQAAIKKNVTIELDLNRNVSDINGDTGQIQQVVMNLIINAAEAIGENNGTIKVTLSNLLVADGTTEMDTFGTVVHSGAYTCLEVSDTGCGMDEETQKRIFEPFYTTKFTGRGLGMSAIRGIVASHNSLLQLSSTPGVGTSFKVCFPVSETSYSEEVSPATPALASLEHWAGTVLLVEDEQTLRVIGTTVLEIFGLSVMTAQHGREALEIYSSHSAEIDLIMLDLLMPVMGGVEAYHELRRIDPTVPIIICSGYDTESISDVIKNDPFTGFVHKPYRPEGLQNEIMRMMAQSVKGTNGLR
jgi:PAS domain S-box-containing protein